VRGALVALAMLALSACAPTIEAAGPPVAAPRLAEGHIVAADGAVLPLRRWLPDGPPKAVILALHGFDDYSNAFEAAGTYFAKHGIATYAYDQRGFGEAPNHGYWPGVDTLIADLRTADRLVAATHPGVPLYLMGESMGGGVVMTARAKPDPAPAAGAILLAPAVWGRATMGFVPRTALWLVAHALPWYKLTGEGLNITPSDNIPMLRALAADPLVIKATRADAVWGVVNLMDRAYAAAPDVASPVLMLYGDKDEIIPREPSLGVMRKLPKGGGNKLGIYPNGYHMLLRDLEGETVMKDIVAWIADHDAPLPSGADRLAAGKLAKAEK
jgi:alpha-beta hydrolase superfamily lysophospholipase